MTTPSRPDRPHAAPARPRAVHGRLLVDGLPARWMRQGALDGRPLVLLAHGAGAPMRSAFLEAVADGLVQRDLAVARFQFPYMQRVVDEGRRRPPDGRPRLLATWRAMLQRAESWHGAGPLVLAGKSMGGRMASLLLAEGGAPAARGVVYLGFPLHPPGRPGIERAQHLARVAVPQLFVSGDRDALARFDLLVGVLDALGHGAGLHRVPGADHSLARGRREPLADGALWLDAVACFVQRLAGP